MKLTLLLAITLCLCATLPACKKSNSASSSVSATFNSTPYKSTSVMGAYYTSNSSFAITSYMVQSNDSTLLTVFFGLPFQVNVPFGPDTTYSGISYVINNGLVYYEAFSPNNMGRLIITITNWDSSGHHIAGTFSGSVVSLASSDDSLTLTNGNFNSTYNVSY